MWWICLVIVLVGANAQEPSPCPELFFCFKEEAKWLGWIHLSPNEELLGVWLKVTLDREAAMESAFGDPVTTKNNKDFLIVNRYYRLDAGDPMTVMFIVMYNTTLAPNLSRIILNGKTICSKRQQTNYYYPKLFTSQLAKRHPVTVPMSGTTERITTERTRTTERITTKRTRTPRKYARTTEDYYEEDYAVPTSTTSSRFDGPTKDYFEGDYAAFLRKRKRRPVNARLIDLNNLPECGRVTKQAVPLIVNGNMAREGDWPWHAALYHIERNLHEYICGAVLVSKRHALTAAHCVTQCNTGRRKKMEDYLLYFGKTYLRRAGRYIQERGLDKISVHPGYNSTFHYNDTAVLTLMTEVDITDFVRPVCLWSGGIHKRIVNEIGVVVGWGIDETGQLANDLSEARLLVVDNSDCIYSNPHLFSLTTSKSSYCAGFRNGTQVCNGDSGGGMYFSRDIGSQKVWEVRGLISTSVASGNGYCDPDSYAVFSDLAYSMYWIRDCLNDNC